MNPPVSQDYLQHIAYNCVVFGFSANQLKILLLESHDGKWLALPGGFVKRNEGLEEAVQRGLKERTRVDTIYLEQFYTFGGFKRNDAGIVEEILKGAGYQVPDSHWMLDRFISIAYYGLINFAHYQPQADDGAFSIDWHPVEALPPLILDHPKIVQKALETLRKNLDRKVIGMHLMPERFTMKELRKVHEAILGEPIQRTNFQRKMLSLGTLKRHEKQYSGKAHKAPYLYSFIPESTERDLF